MYAQNKLNYRCAALPVEPIRVIYNTDPSNEHPVISKNKADLSREVKSKIQATGLVVFIYQVFPILK